MQDAGQGDAAARRDARGQQFGQRVQRRGQDVGDHDRVGGNRFVPRQVRGDAHAVAFAVVGGGGQRLRVVVHAHRGGGAELQRGQREDARAAAEIEHAAAGQFAIGGQLVEPAQAQRGGRVGARAERQPGIQPHHGGIGRLRRLGQLMVPRHDPGALAEPHGLELVQPGAFPVLVLDRTEAGAAPVQAGVEGFQRGQQRQRVGIGREQRGQHQFVPQRGLAHARLQDRALVAGVGIGVEHRHRQRADILQGVFVAGLGGFGAAQGEFEERHGDDGDNGTEAGILVEAAAECARCPAE